MRLINNIKWNSLFGTILSMFSWVASSQIIIFIAYPIITRVYSPSDFGTYAVFCSIMYILNGVITLRSEVLIPLPKDDTEAKDRYNLSLLCLITSTITLSLILLSTSNTFISLFRINSITPSLFLIPFSACIIGLRNCLLFYANRLGEYKTIGVANFIQGPIMVALQLSMPLLLKGPISLIIGGVASWVCACLYLIFKLSTKVNLKPNFSNTKYLLTILITELSFIINSTLSTLLLNISTYIPTLLFSAMFGPTVAAWYALALQASSPLDLISNAASQIYIGEGTKLYNKSKTKLLEFYYKNLKLLFAIAILPLLTLFFYGQPLFSFVFGLHWSMSGQFAELMAPMLLIRFCVRSASQNLIILKKQQFSLLWSITFLILIFASFIPAFIQTNHLLKATDIVILLASSSSLAYALLMALNITLTKKTARLVLT